MDLSTDFLRTFIAVCEYSSFSIAGAKRHKSQSAVSTQIAKLEEQAGLKFLDRSQHPLRLTEPGKVFLDFAKDVVTKTDEVGRFLVDVTSGVKGEVRIGVTRSIGTYIVPDIIRKIYKDFPNLKIVVLTQQRTAIFESLRQGKIDFALILTDTCPADFRATVLKGEPLCMVISRRHRSLNKRPLSLAQVQSIPFIVGVSGNEFSDMVARIIEKSGLGNYSIGLRISSLQGRKEAARAGSGVAILPRFVVQKELRKKSLTTLQIRGVRLTDTSIMLVERLRRTTTPSVEFIKRILEKTIKNH